MYKNLGSKQRGYSQHQCRCEKVSDSGRSVGATLLLQIRWLECLLSTFLEGDLNIIFDDRLQSNCGALTCLDVRDLSGATVSGVRSSPTCVFSVIASVKGQVGRCDYNKLLHCNKKASTDP